MITHEQDPDVVRWGLQLFDSDPYANCAYSGAMPQNNLDYYQNHYFKGDQFSTESANEENHNFNAQCLQEELSQLSVAEPPSMLHQMAEHTQPHFYPQDWFTQPMGNYNIGIGSVASSNLIITVLGLISSVYSYCNFQEKRTVMKKKLMMELPLHALAQEKSHIRGRTGRIHLNWRMNMILMVK